MKITKSKLKQIIKEETKLVLEKDVAQQVQDIKALADEGLLTPEEAKVQIANLKRRAAPQKGQASAADSSELFAGGTRVAPGTPQQAQPGAVKAATVKASALAKQLQQVLQALQGSLKEARINFSDLVVETGNSKEGILAAYNDVCEGKRSKTSAPVKVNWIEEERKFLVVDGLHRIVEFIEKGKSSCLCEIDWKAGTDGWKLPSKSERFKSFSLKELKALRRKRLK